MPVVAKKDRKALGVVFRGFEGSPTDYDPDVQAWLDAINAAGGSVSSGQADAVNAYWIIQKAAGLDLLAIADYPMVGDRIAMEFNLKNPAQFRLTFVNTVPGDFTDGGWKPNGVDSFADTGLIPSDDTVEFDATLEYYARDGVDKSGAALMGARAGNAAAWTIQTFNGQLFSNVYYSQDDPLGSPNNPPGLGQYLTTGSLPNNVNSYLNGLEQASRVDGPGVRPTVSVYLGGRNNLGALQFESISECAGAGIYAGVTPIQAAAWFLARQAMNLLLNREVGPSTLAVLKWVIRINEAGGTVTDEEILAVDNYWKAQLVAGVAQKAIADYPMVGDEIAMEFNLADADTFRMVFNNTNPEDFTEKGWESNGGSWGDPGLNPVDDFPLDSIAIECWSNSQSETTGFEDIGAGPFNGNMFTITTFPNPANSMRADLPSRIDVNPGPAIAGAYFGSQIASRQSIDNFRLYMNGVVQGENLAPHAGFVADDFFLGGRNNNGVPSSGRFSKRIYQGFGFYQGLTGQDVLDFSNNRRALQVELDREETPRAENELRRIRGIMSDPMSPTVEAALLTFLESQTANGNWDLIDEIYLLAADTEANSLIGLRGLKTAINNGAAFTTLEGYEFSNNNIDTDFSMDPDASNVDDGALHVFNHRDPGGTGSVRPYLTAALEGNQSLTGIQSSQDNDQMRAFYRGNATFPSVPLSTFPDNTLIAISRDESNRVFYFNGIVQNTVGANLNLGPATTIPFYIGAVNNQGAQAQEWNGEAALWAFSLENAFDHVSFSDAVAQLLNDINPGVFP